MHIYLSILIDMYIYLSVCLFTMLRLSKEQGNMWNIFDTKKLFKNNAAHFKMFIFNCLLFLAPL